MRIQRESRQGVSSWGSGWLDVDKSSSNPSPSCAWPTRLTPLQQRLAGNGGETVELVLKINVQGDLDGRLMTHQSLPFRVKTGFALHSREFDFMVLGLVCGLNDQDSLLDWLP